ncbi:hypothetical protein BGZ94_005005, partial [Podila epigama]
FGTSAKDNNNIEEAARFLLTEIMATEEEHSNKVTDDATMIGRIQLSQSKTKEGCC